MKKIYFIILLILFPNIVFANSIKSINMDIYIDSDGTAHVEETWEATLNEGTEGYKPYYNLDYSEITNFKVSLNGKEYTYLDNWDINESFTYKKYKNGINYASAALELCFGISEYGTNTYILNYDISNFVVNTSDGYQMVYWTLFPNNYDPSPENVHIEIRSDFEYADTLDVWGYGKYGAPTYVDNGKIYYDSEGKVHSNEYVVLLVKFPNNSFNAKVTLNNSFDDYFSMAENGAIHYEKDNDNDSLFALFMIILTFFIPIVVIVLVCIFGNYSQYGHYRIHFGKTGNKVRKDVSYFRDIPYAKEDLRKAYWISCYYNLIKRKTDFLGAILLKWYKDRVIDIKKDDKNKTIIYFNSCACLDALETELYQMMYEASRDGILEEKEFDSWCKKKYEKIIGWFDNIIDSATSSFLTDGFLENHPKRKKQYIAKPEMMKEAEKIAGLKKFLNDFSNIKDRSAIEVELWEEYLMYACIFGISKKVIKEFRDIYPDVITEDVYTNFMYLYLISNNGMKTAVSARNQANSYSSGGGGFSSGGGGGGSFGGGGGGGGFR